jgi:hypothetical protein
MGEAKVYLLASTRNCGTLEVGFRALGKRRWCTERRGSVMDFCVMDLWIVLSSVNVWACWLAREA